MNDRIFFDSNVLIYAHTDKDLHKQGIAQTIIETSDVVISTQVLQETANVLHKKIKKEWPLIIEILTDITTNTELHTNTTQTIYQACNISKKYNTSFYDSLIIAAALETNCYILYSEDMHNGLIIDKKLTITNPFVKL